MLKISVISLRSYPISYKDAKIFINSISVVTSKLKNVFREELKLKIKEIIIIDNEIKVSLKTRDMMQCYESPVHKEREKAKIYQQKLHMIMYHMHKYFKEWEKGVRKSQRIAKYK
jgi:hypothetical protein